MEGGRGDDGGEWRRVEGKEGERLRDCPDKLILPLLFHIRIIFDTPRFLAFFNLPSLTASFGVDLWKIFPGK